MSLEVIVAGVNVPFADLEIFFDPIADSTDNYLIEFIVNRGMERGLSNLKKLEKSCPILRNTTQIPLTKVLSFTLQEGLFTLEKPCY